MVAFYLIATAVIIVQLMLVSLAVTRDMFGSITHQPLCKFFFNALADAILLLAPYWALRRRRRLYALVVLWLVAVWSFAQIVYYTSYHDLMPFSSFLMVGNLSPTLFHSVMGTISKRALVALLLPLVAHAAAWLMSRKGLVEKAPNRHWWLMVASLVAYVVMRLVITTSIYLTNRQNYDDLHDAFVSRYTRLGGRHRNYVMHNGATPYALYCFYTAIDLGGPSREDIEQATAFVDGQCPHYTDNPYATTISRPNLIFIMVESLNAWAVNLDIDGRPVTPTLNALAADTAANIVCLNMLSQAKNGRSSDGKFIYQTGLLPLLDKSVAVEFSNRSFPSLAKTLKARGYKTVEMCGDEAGLWNVEGMSRAYGFDTLYHAPELHEQLEACDYLIDKVVMDFAASYLPRQQQPFMAQLFTGVMHSPYDGQWRIPTWISSSKQYTPAVRNYLEKTHYFDTQLGIFLHRLKQCGLYDHSVVVIASDHNEWVDDDPAGRPAISRDGNECVLLVLNAARGKNVAGPIGQVDVFPTLLDVMGLNVYSRWKGLGHSILRFDVTSVATSPDELQGLSSMQRQQAQAWSVNEVLIHANHFPAR